MKNPGREQPEGCSRFLCRKRSALAASLIESPKGLMEIQQELRDHTGAEHLCLT